MTVGTRAARLKRTLAGVGDMGFVIGAIEVDAVPAGWEENLSAHAVGAVVIEEIRTLSPVGIV